jgi:hypothetical protein
MAMPPHEGPIHGRALLLDLLGLKWHVSLFGCSSHDVGHDRQSLPH